MTALTVIECDTCRRTHRSDRTLHNVRIHLSTLGWTRTPPDRDTCPLCAMNAFLASLDEPETKP